MKAVLSLGNNMDAFVDFGAHIHILIQVCQLPLDGFANLVDWQFLHHHDAGKIVCGSYDIRVQQLETPTELANDAHNLKASQHQHDNPSPVSQDVPGIAQKDLIQSLQRAHRLILARHDSPWKI